MAKKRENNQVDKSVEDVSTSRPNREDILSNIGSATSEVAQTLNDPSSFQQTVSEQAIANAGEQQISSPDVSAAAPRNDLTQLSQPDITGNIPVDPQQQIVNETLAGINRTGAQTPVDEAINRSIFGSSTQQAQGAAGGAPLIQQGNELFRGINDPILKGNVSGQVIGSQPIFVGGGDFAAIDVLNNRQKAIQDAAIKKQEDAQKFLDIKPPIVKDQRFQRSLNERFNATKEEHFRLAEEEFGAGWVEALQDQTNPVGRAFVQDMANYDFVAGQSDQVTDLIADIDKNLESGDVIFSDETLELRDQYNDLQGAFLDGRVSGAVDLAGEFGKLQGFANLDKVINDQGIDIKGTVTGFASILENDNSFVTTTQKKTEYEDQLKIIAGGLAKSQMRDAVRQGLITEEEIFDRINARYGYENVTTKKVTTKPGGGAIKLNINLDSEFGEPKGEKIGDTEYNVFDAIEVPTGIKPLSASGLTVINPDGTTSKVSGVRDVDLNSFQVVEVPDPNNPNKFIKKKVVVGTHTETELIGAGKTQDVTKTVLYDMDQIGSRIKTDLLQEPEQWEKMNQRFDAQIEQELVLPEITEKSR